jgi:hypothetical protein
MMKAHFFLTLVAMSGLALGGCANDIATTTTRTTTDQTTTRVHTQEELRKTGETDPGRALEKSDAAIRTEGNR